MVTRISGFASGLDIDSLVKDLMKAKRAPLDKLTQQKMSLEWQREQYRDLNIKMIDLRNNKLFNYNLSGSLSAKQVSVSGNTSAVSAKATSSAEVGSMTVEVKKLGTYQSVVNNVGIGGVIEKVDLNAKLKDLQGKLNYVKDTPVDPDDPDAPYKLSLTINGKKITLDERTDTLKSMVAKINADTDVTAYIDGETGKFSLTSKAMEDKVIEWDDTAGHLLDVLLYNKSSGDANSQQAGSMAEVVINGITMEKTSNTFIQDGVEITLNAESSSVSNLTIKANTDSIVDSVKAFIKDYNDLMDSVNNKLNEERYRSYAPLTTAQKADMKDDEIKLWEEKARSGLLRRDPTLTTMVDNLRLAMLTDVVVDGKEVNLLRGFGIDTGDWQQRGKLILKDEAELRAAIEKDPDAFEKMFTQQTQETDLSKKNSPTTADNGLFNRLSNVLMTGIDGLSSKAGTSKVSTSKDSAFLESSLISEQLRTLNTRISDFNDRISRWETAYYKQFTAMEKAMNRYQSQSSLFSS